MKLKEKVCCTPFISVVIPVRNETAFIHRVLEAVLNQDYPNDCYEILVVDGQSDDGTQALVRDLINQRQEMGLQHPEISLFNNPKRIVPTAMNMGIKKSKGDIIARIDGHALIHPSYLMKSIEVMQETGADVVGGPIETIGSDSLSQTIAIAMSTPYGVGNSAFRTSRVSQFTDTVPFGTFKKQVLIDAGLFDERLIRHQDYELNYRIRRNGGRVFLSSDIKSSYYARSNLKKLTKQFFQYGLFKGRVLHIHPASLKLRHLVPPVFVSCELFGLVLSFFFTAAFNGFCLILLLYSLFLAIATIHVQLKHKLNFMLFPLIIALVHHSWGFGVLAGLLTPLRAKNKS
ncbi:MAG: succinoglycan biosynthesis protein exoa [Acidobacteria bacterium]|nr:MAG: succinoglycan biosynthesis protein exoa [Acidobacteriota bacterium]